MRDDSFIGFASRGRILTILIKERVKWIGKVDNPKKAKDAQKTNDQKEEEEKSVYDQLCEILPPRRSWVTPGQKYRSKLRNEQTRQRQNAAAAIRQTIKRDRSATVRPGYLSKLDSFIQKIKDAVASGTPSLEKPDTTAMFKKKEDRGDCLVVTFRPISVYNDLTTKVLIKLASDYLTAVLDPLFHEEILSYRKRRNYHGEHPKRYYMTKADDAIPNIQRFRETHDTVWVAECDIKKFYDIVNHDRVMEALNRLLRKGHIPKEKVAGAVAILQEYLDNYSFKKSVLDKSREEGFWKDYIAWVHGAFHPGKKEIICQFAWVDEQEFFARGGYSPDTWDADCTKIGIPQGGAFSTLISNILLNDVDQAVVKESDPDRLFNRYGDDIILMHRTEKGCKRLFEAYKKALQKHQLIYHDEKVVGDIYKNGAKTLPGYWEEKTKAPFFWGPGEGNASEWIGFVGYEIRCNGDIRLRKSTFMKQFSGICSKYHKVLEKTTEIRTDIPHCLKKFDRTAWSIQKFERLTFNPASQRQMHLLDRVRHNKRRKAVAKLKTLPVNRPEKAVLTPLKQPASYAAVLECMNKGH